MRVLAALGIGVVSLPGYSERSTAQQNPVTAIDVALEPDATMIQHAKADNARLLKAYPMGLCSGRHAQPACHDYCSSSSARLTSTRFTRRPTRLCPVRTRRAGN
jgi:hypothetical protein